MRRARKSTDLHACNSCVSELLRFKPYFGDNGGVTFSGGEPLLQKDFLCQVLRLCKHAGHPPDPPRHRSEMRPRAATRKLLGRYDSFDLLDIQALLTRRLPQHHGDSLRRSLYNFFPPCKTPGTPLWIRHVVVRLTDSDAHLEGLRLHTIRNIQRVSASLPHAGCEQVSCTGYPVSPLEDVPALPPEALADWQQRFDREFHI